MTARYSGCKRLAWIKFRKIKKIVILIRTALFVLRNIYLLFNEYYKINKKVNLKYKI